MQLFELKSLSRSGNKHADGSYDVFERELGIFDSVEKAETFMKQVIDREKRFYAFHCFVIFEKTLNRGLARDSGAVCEFESVRSYFPDGALYCDSPYDDGCEKPFRGRPAETIRLKIGDVAWCWEYGRIIPCLVAGLPLTDAGYLERIRELGHEMGLDGSDDSYMVYTAARHEHPECWRCMPFYGKISGRTLQRIRSCRFREEAECRSKA